MSEQEPSIVAAGNQAPDQEKVGEVCEALIEANRLSFAEIQHQLDIADTREPRAVLSAEEANTVHANPSLSPVDLRTTVQEIDLNDVTEEDIDEARKSIRSALEWDEISSAELPIELRIVARPDDDIEATKERQRSFLTATLFLLDASKERSGMGEVHRFASVNRNARPSELTTLQLARKTVDAENAQNEADQRMYTQALDTRLERLANVDAPTRLLDDHPDIPALASNTLVKQNDEAAVTAMARRRELGSIVEAHMEEYKPFAKKDKPSSPPPRLKAPRRRPGWTQQPPSSPSPHQLEEAGLREREKVDDSYPGKGAHISPVRVKDQEQRPLPTDSAERFLGGLGLH